MALFILLSTCSKKHKSYENFYFFFNLINTCDCYHKTPKAYRPTWKNICQYIQIKKTLRYRIHMAQSNFKFPLKYRVLIRNNSLNEYNQHAQCRELLRQENEIEIFKRKRKLSKMNYL